MFPVEVGSAEEHSCADTELILPVALKVSELRVEVVGLNCAYPDVSGYGDVEASADGRSVRCVVGGGKLADGSRKVAVKSVHSAEERLSEGLKACVVGKAHSNTSHSIEKAQTRVEARDVIGGVTSCLDDGGEVMPDGHGDSSLTTGHPEAAAAADRRVRVHLAEHGVGIDRVARPLC